MRIKMLPGALVIAALVTLAISLGVATPNVYGGGDDTLPTLPEKPELKYPNLGSNLDQLVASVEKGETSAKEAAEDASVHQEASVAVTIYLSGNLDDVVKFLEDNGGSPRNVGEDYIEAYVPLSLLGQVLERPGVIRVREIAPPQAAQIAQQVAGHGPPVHGSSAWNQAGFSGQGVKVGVIDTEFSFNDFRGLMGTELPSTVQARCYTDVGRFTSNLSNCGNALVGNNHGTLLAEAVMDIAPEASLYIAAPWSLGDLQTATAWMVSQGVSVIVHGVTYEYDGPGDGTSPFSDSPLKTVDRAVSGGIVWVNAAGNQGQRAWFGDYSIVNVDGTKFVAFNGSDIFNDMTLEAWDWITVQLRWEDSWSAANRDFDLLIWDFATSDIVDYSFDPQQGRVGQVPFESLSYLVPNDGRYAVVVVHEGGSTPEWIQLTAWGVGSIEHYTGTGSIANPAESSNPGMLAVGAAHWNSVGSIDPYSSRGPTPDGRVKPEIVGATCGETALRPLNESNEGFCGTSQSAPHIAGMAALVRQRFPTYTAVEVADYLKEHAEQRESPDPNNTWGHGFAKLPSLSECSDAVPSAASNPGLVADCEVLLAARDTLAGSGTLNWSGSTAIAAWDDVTLSGSPLRVTSLVLSDSQLTGTIPPELGNLNNLERLNLTRNQLTGDIPPELSLLTNLQLLALGGNQLTGPIPTWMGSLAKLQELQLWGNQFTGAIPPELGNLPGLVKLGLSENQLSGQIPSQLASLTNLQRLSLYDNQLSGPVPTWLESLVNLQELYLSQNQLTGVIPTELESLVNLEQLVLWGNHLTGVISPGLSNLTNLEVLSLSNNQLTGVIPTELGILTNLEILALGGNQLSGPVPTWMGSLADLQELYLSQNQLSGAIPTELGSLSKLQVLYLWGNQLTGPIPASLGGLANLEQLALSQNQLTGAIPTELGSLSKLQVLFLSGNQLSGPVPTWMGSLADLQELYLSQNQLSGAIPTELGSLSKLQVLYLWGNQLTGPIPPQLSSLANLTILSLWGNELTGEIPAGLGSLTNLTILSLWGNELTGEIPAGLGSLANLVQLQLSDNQLTGEIPVELGSLTNLTILSLWGNELTGEIPAGLGSLANLVQLQLSDNQLTGGIPAELGSLAGLEELFLEENGLTGGIPAGLGSLANLVQLQLSDNQLTGGMPAELGSLTNLEGLYLNDNQLTGGIPTELGSLSNLRALILNNNQLTGEIPAGLGSLTNLVHLVLSGNQLTGCIPNGLRGIETNDLSQLALLFCDMPGAPTIATPIVPGDASLTVAWAAPINTGSSAITAYDLRYIETGAADKSDANWTVVEDVWAAGSGSLQYTLSGLTGGTQYDVQVRGVNAAGASAWSATVTGTTTSAVVGTAPVFSDSEGNPITEAVRSVVENTAAGENVGAPVTAMDADNDTLTYSLGGTDMASFDIDPSTGQIMGAGTMGAGTMLDYETKASYMVTVTATDPDSASDMITVTITVTNEEEMGEVTLWAGMDALTMAPQVGDTITGAVMDPDGGVTGETWQWAKTKTPDMMDSWMGIGTGGMYTVIDDDAGYYLRATAMYDDGEGMGKMASEQTMMVGAMAAEMTLLDRYDKNNSGRIDKDELADGVFDYNVEQTLSKDELVELIFSYEIG